METKTAAELVALVVKEIREHPEYDHIAGVSVMPRIPQPSHPANWRVELSVSGFLRIMSVRTSCFAALISWRGGGRRGFFPPQPPTGIYSSCCAACWGPPALSAWIALSAPAS